MLKTLIVNQIKLGRVGNKKLFPDTIMDKLSGLNSSFHVKYDTTRKVQLPFFRSFLLVSQKIHFWRKTEH